MMDSERIGFYSVDPDGNRVSDASRVNYIRTVSDDELPFDLNVRLVNCAQYYGTEFKNFLKYLEENEGLLDRSRQPRNFPFVCTSALKTLSEQGTLHITACLYRETIYLRAQEVNYPFSESDIEASQLLKSWNLKFRQFMQLNVPDEKSNTEKLALGIEQFNIVCKSTINGHTIIHTEPVDGIYTKGEGTSSDESPFTHMDIVNLYTTVYQKTEKQEKSYRIFKTQKMWMNSLLLGANSIILGHRDSEGILRAIQKTSADHMVELGEGYWDPKKCIWQMNRILTKIKSTFLNKIPLQNQNDICTLYFKKTSRISVSQVDRILEVPAEDAENFPKISLV